MDAATAATVMLGLQVVGKPSMEIAKDLVLRLVGPTVDATAKVTAHSIEAWQRRRVERGQKVVLGAGDILAAEGKEISPVPDAMLVAIIEHSSIAPEDLQDKWSALLANSSSSLADMKVLPAFADILRQLTPVHARILDWIFGQAVDGSMGFLRWPDIPRDDLEEHFNLSPEDYALLVSDLDRLQVLEGRRDTKLPTHLSFSKEELVELIVGRWDSQEKYRLVTLTTLGVRFMFACTHPSQTRIISARVKSR